MALSARSVHALGEGNHLDGAGLYLRVRGASRAWVYRWKVNGKHKELGLGATTGQRMPIQLSVHHKISGADDRADAACHIKINHLNIIKLLLLCGGGGEIRTHEGR